MAQDLCPPFRCLLLRFSESRSHVRRRIGVPCSILRSRRFWLRFARTAVVAAPSSGKMKADASDDEIVMLGTRQDKLSLPQGGDDACAIQMIEGTGLHPLAVRVPLEKASRRIGATRAHHFILRAVGPDNNGRFAGRSVRQHVDIATGSVAQTVEIKGSVP